MHRLGDSKMKANFKKLFKSYMEAYEGFSKCWYAYYSRDNGNSLNQNKHQENR